MVLGVMRFVNIAQLGRDSIYSLKGCRDEVEDS